MLSETEGGNDRIRWVSDHFDRRQDNRWKKTLRDSIRIPIETYFFFSFLYYSRLFCSYRALDTYRQGILIPTLSSIHTYHPLSPPLLPRRTKPNRPWTRLRRRLPVPLPLLRRLPLQSTFQSLYCSNVLGRWPIKVISSSISIYTQRIPVLNNKLFYLNFILNPLRRINNNNIIQSVAFIPLSRQNVPLHVKNTGIGIAYSVLSTTKLLIWKSKLSIKLIIPR